MRWLILAFSFSFVLLTGCSTEVEGKSASREVVGIWTHDEPYVGSTVTIYRDNSKVYLESIYVDGSLSNKEMIVTKNSNSTKLVEKGGNSHGEYFILGENGELQAGGENGIFRKYIKIK